MAYGAVVLGYARPEVDQAAWREISRGMLISMNHPLQARFLEAVLRRFPAAEMGYFMKTGSEATTAAVRLARRFTGRRKVIRCGFHGWHDWCFGGDRSTPAGISEQVITLDPVSPEALAQLLAGHRDEVAAVIMAPEMVMPLVRPTMQALIEVTHDHGALFVLDEIKTGFRTRGGSAQHLLDVRPDLTTLSKALGNGWPVSAVIGRADVVRAGQGLHLSATFHGETAAMAAALENLEIMEREHVPDRLWRLGERLIDGLNDIARRLRAPARAYGEPLPMMPFLAFTHADEQVNRRLRHAFYGEMFQRGVLLHPRHLWYTCFDHTDADIDHALAAAEAAIELARARTLD